MRFAAGQGQRQRQGQRQDPEQEQGQNEKQKRDSREKESRKHKKAGIAAGLHIISGNVLEFPCEGRSAEDGCV